MTRTNYNSCSCVPMMQAPPCTFLSWCTRKWQKTVIYVWHPLAWLPRAFCSKHALRVLVRGLYQRFRDTMLTGSTSPSRWERLFSSIDFTRVPDQHSSPQLQGFHAVLPGHICRSRRMIRRPIYHAKGVIQGTCDKGRVSGPLGASARAHGRAPFVSTGSLLRCFSWNCSVGLAFTHIVRSGRSEPGGVLGRPRGNYLSILLKEYLRAWILHYVSKGGRSCTRHRSLDQSYNG